MAPPSLDKPRIAFARQTQISMVEGEKNDDERRIPLVSLSLSSPIPLLPSLREARDGFFYMSWCLFFWVFSGWLGFLGVLSSWVSCLLA
jgi:hypothetical protein